jgi:hypothetical protein
MRCLARNKQTVYYALFTGKTEIKDENGDGTGQYELHYAEPVEWAANIRWDSGSIELEGFGLNDSGARRIVTCDMDCPICDSTVLWIGITPDANGAYGAVQPNFVVSGVPERSLNQIAFRVMEVNKSWQPQSI